MFQTFLINVSGKVQGVFFRQSTKEKARNIGIKGKVFNLANGDVQIIATGTPEQLDALLKWCRQGPAKAVVNNVNHQEVTLQNFDSFFIEKI